MFVELMNSAYSPLDARGEAVEPRMDDHIERVRHCLSMRTDEKGIIDMVTKSTASLVQTPISLPPENLKTPVEGYGRNLLYQDPDYGFVMVAMVWPPEVGTPVHDHGTWGVVGVNEGRLNVTNYSRDDDGSDPERADLSKLDTISAGEGMAAHVLPPDEDIHKVWNPTAKRAVSIHTYGESVNVCNVFDLDEGTIEQRRLSYTV